MKTIQSVLLITITVCLLYSQTNSPPEITNVTFEQRSDGSFMVDVYYDVNDADGDTMSVSMQVSDDAGVTWEFSCALITGDVGSDIASGTNKHIVWDFGKEHPQTFSDQFQFKIIANDHFIETGTVTDIDGNVYKTVKIGEQWWMAENLKVTHYRNGAPIPNIIDNSDWQSLTTGAYCAYNNDASNISTYGLLYNWYALNDSQNIAPAGWHVPSDEEWMELEEHLGMSQIESTKSGIWRGTNEGNKLKSISGWYNDGNGKNEFCFIAVPGGTRDLNLGEFYRITRSGYWWTISEYYSIRAWFRELNYDESGIYRYYVHKQFGMSVRCIKD